MAYSKDDAKKGFVLMDEAFKLALAGNANGYKSKMGEAFSIFAGYDTSAPNADYIGSFLESIYENIDRAVAFAGKLGMGAQTAAQVIKIHQKAQEALLGPYISKYDTALTDEEKDNVLKSAKTQKNLTDIVQELSR